MSSVESVLPSRTTTVLVVVAFHALVLWAIWVVHPKVSADLDSFVSEAFFFEDDRPKLSAATPQPTRTRAPASEHTVQSSALSFAPASTDTSTAISEAPPRDVTIDWSGELKGAAKATLDQEHLDAKQLGALTRQYQTQDDPRNPHAGPGNSFRWYDAGSHRIDTRSAIPILHLNDRCMMIAFIFPVCAIGHIETHGDLFDNAAAVHDEKLATHRPNDPP